MNRLITAFILAIATVCLVAAPRDAAAQPAPGTPSPADLAAAKKAFLEGKALFEKGQFEAAVPKFIESHRLSKKADLLYNVALAYEEAKQLDVAELYYKRYLKESDPAAVSRPDAEERLKKIQVANGTAPPPVGTGSATPPDKKDPPKQITIKPPGTYSATDFKHQVVMEAPPSKPLDVTAYVPEDSGWTVTLFFRGAGDTKFYTKVMKPRYNEVVARIPGARVGGVSIQYYIEVKDQTGAVVTRSAKSTSPNLVGIEQTAPPRFYPDWTDDDNGTAAMPANPANPKGGSDLEEDPLHPKNGGQVEVPIGPTGPTGPEGPADIAPETKTMKYLKYGTTIGAATFIGLSVLFYIQAGNYASALSDDIQKCPAGMAAPCHPFDDYDKSLQDTGQQRQTFMTVALVAGVATAGVAGYLWYKGLKAKQARSPSTSPDSPTPTGPPKTEPAHDEFSWIVAPAVGDGYAGAAALLRF